MVDAGSAYVERHVMLDTAGQKGGMLLKKMPKTRVQCFMPPQTY